MKRDENSIERGTDEHTPPHGDPLGDRNRSSLKNATRGSSALQKEDAVPSTATDEPERASFADALPGRSHSLDPSVPEGQESREQAPPSPDWLEPPSAA
jgi:hypothetical protein